MSKFDNVPVDADTAIVCQQEVKLGGYDVLYQKWTWDGITAESMIFSNEDIIGLEDDDIEAEVRLSPLVNKNEEMTLKRSESGFTFVNFNFQIEDLSLETFLSSQKSK